MNLFKLNKKEDSLKKTSDELDYSDIELMEKGYVIYHGKDYRLYLNKEKNRAKLVSDRSLSEDEIEEILQRHLRDN
jgi:hypothetical protein